MDSTFNDSTKAIRGDVNEFKAHAVDAARKVKAAGGQEVSNLMADVQDLLSRVTHVADPEIARLRTKVEQAMTTAKKAIADGSEQVQKQAKNAMAAGDAYVQEQPWQAVGVAAVVGLVVGYLAARR